MENRERICRFCFEKCDTHFKAIERSTREILNILLVTTNLAICDEPVMCENCSEILQKSFAFKNICLSIQDNTVAFGNVENKDRVCTFCINVLKDNSFTILDVDKDISEKTMLEKYFPELIDLSASKKPVICEVCRESLVVFLSFITISSIVEEKIKEYCEAKGVHNTDPIKLKDVLQFTSENIWKENDNKLDVFKMEDMVSTKKENEQMKIEEGTCILCLEKRKNCKAVDGNTKNILGIILPKIDFTGVQELVMCENCEGVLKKCFDFKATSLQTHNDYIVPFLNKNDIQLDLKDVYLSKNVTCTGVPHDHEICAFCMRLVNNCSAISIDDEEAAIMLERMIMECLQELDLSIIKKPVICISCHGSLEDCFHFVMKCFIVKEQNKECCETPYLNTESQTELSSSLQFTTRNIKREIDGNLSNKIEVEDQFCEDSENLDDGEIGNAGDRVKLERMILDDSVDANKDVENKYESFMERNDQEVNEQKFTSKNVLTHGEGSSKPFCSIKIEDIGCVENESVEMDDQKCLLNEEIEIKTDDQDFNRFEDGIVLPQSEVAGRLHRREKCSVLNLERDQLKSDIKHTLTNRQISKIRMCQCEPCSFQTKHDLILEGFKKRPARKDATEVTMLNCDSCSFQTRKKYSKIHLLTHKDPSKVTVYKCGFCSHQTKIKANFKRHLLIHKDPSEVTMYKCDFCSYQTKIKSLLKRHSLKHKDGSGIMIYKCDFCSLQTKFKHLKYRLLIHKDPSEVTMYKCDSCLYQTKFKSYLKTHLLKHRDPSEITMYKCDFCSFQTKIKSCLNRHLLKHRDSSEVTMYKCDFCSFQTKINSLLQRHLLKHKDPSEVTMYKCNSCLFQTKFKNDLKQHLLKHKDPSAITMYKCDFCSFQTKTKSCLNRHLLTHTDPSEMTVYKCDFCSYQTKIKRYLKSHLLKHKDLSEVIMYRCDFCSFQTKFNSSLGLHLLKHKDPSEVPTYKCDFCSFQTKYTRSFNRHLLTHKDPSEVTMYKCDSCLYQTKFKSYLKTHLLKHRDPSEITMYKCDFCSFQTKTKSCLKSHLLKHKDLSEVILYTCDFCSFQTKFNCSLGLHLLKHKDPSEVPTYKCDFCSFQTKYTKSLNRHLLTHKDPSEVTMYKCDSCLYQTKFKSYLQKHLTKHENLSEITMYKCNYCSFQTKHKVSLQCHELTHKNDQK